MTSPIMICQQEDSHQKPVVTGSIPAGFVELHSRRTGARFTQQSHSDKQRTPVFWIPNNNRVALPPVSCARLCSSQQKMNNQPGLVDVQTTCLTSPNVMD